MSPACPSCKEPNLSFDASRVGSHSRGSPCPGKRGDLARTGSGVRGGVVGPQSLCGLRGLQGVDRGMLWGTAGDRVGCEGQKGWRWVAPGLHRRGAKGCRRATGRVPPLQGAHGAPPAARPPLRRPRKGLRGAAARSGEGGGSRGLVRSLERGGTAPPSAAALPPPPQSPAGKVALSLVSLAPALPPPAPPSPPFPQPLSPPPLAP